MIQKNQLRVGQLYEFEMIRLSEKADVFPFNVCDVRGKIVGKCYSGAGCYMSLILRKTEDHTLVLIGEMVIQVPYSFDNSGWEGKMSCSSHADKHTK